jgi:hypothetical protein
MGNALRLPAVETIQTLAGPGRPPTTDKLPTSVRDIVGAVLLSTATAATLMSAFAAPWTVALPAALLLGTLGTLLDLRYFDRPVQRTTVAGKRTVRALAAVFAICALGLAFDAGQSAGSGSAQSYAYVANGKLIYDFIYFAPTMKAQSDSKVAPGTPVRVDCYVTTEEGRWYRLLQDEGWVSDQQFLPALHTGRGTPPLCPK